MKVTNLFFIVYGVLFGVVAPCTAGAELLKDPMRPPDYMATMEDSPRVLNLSTTYVSEKGRYAMINKQLLREGDAIGGARIISIKPGMVILEREGEELRLSVLPRSLKIPRGENQ